MPERTSDERWRRALRTVMERENLGVEKLAERLGVTRPMVSRWLSESKPRSPNVDSLARAAEKLGVSANYVLHNQGGVFLGEALADRTVGQQLAVRVGQELAARVPKDLVPYLRIDREKLVSEAVNSAVAHYSTEMRARIAATEIQLHYNQVLTGITGLCLLAAMQLEPGDHAALAAVKLDLQVLLTYLWRDGREALGPLKDPDATRHLIPKEMIPSLEHPALEQLLTTQLQRLEADGYAAALPRLESYACAQDALGDTDSANTRWWIQDLSASDAAQEAPPAKRARRP